MSHFAKHKTQKINFKLFHKKLTKVVEFSSAASLSTSITLGQFLSLRTKGKKFNSDIFYTNFTFQFSANKIIHLEHFSALNFYRLLSAEGTQAAISDFCLRRVIFLAQIIPIDPFTWLSI